MGIERGIVVDYVTGSNMADEEQKGEEEASVVDWFSNVSDIMRFDDHVDTGCKRR